MKTVLIKKWKTDEGATFRIEGGVFRSDKIIDISDEDAIALIAVRKESKKSQNKNMDLIYRVIFDRVKLQTIVISVKNMSISEEYMQKTGSRSEFLMPNEPIETRYLNAVTEEVKALLETNENNTVAFDKLKKMTIGSKINSIAAYPFLGLLH